MTTHKILGTRIGLIAVEILAAGVLVLAVLLGMAVWWLKSGPVNIGFAKPYIEGALSNSDSGFQVTIGAVALYWPELRGPLLLGVEDAALYNAEGRKLLSLDEAAISLSKRRLLIGQVAPKSLLIKRPNLYLLRTEDNRLDFGLQGTAQTEAAAEEENVLQTLIKHIAKPGTAAEEDATLARLRRLEIQDANIVIEDKILRASWQAPDFDVLFESRKEGLHSTLSLGLENGKSGSKAGVEVEAFYDWSAQAIDATATISNFNTDVLVSKIPELEGTFHDPVVLNGKIQGSLDAALTVQHLSMALSSDKGAIASPSIRPEPLRYSGLQIEALYDAAERSLFVPRLEAEVEEIPVVFSADLALGPGASVQSVSGAVSLRVPELAHRKIVALWPQILADDSSREWMVEKIKDARYTNISADAEVAVTKNPEGGEGWTFGLKDLKARLDFESAHVDYKNPLTPVTEGSGAALFDLARDTLAVHITGGKLDDLTVGRSTLFFDEVVAVGTGGVHMDIDAAGPLRSALRYIADEPIGIGKERNIPYDQVEGTAKLAVKMAFPTTREVFLKDMDIDITGTIEDGVLPEIVGDLPLNGADLALDVDNVKAAITGTAQLVNAPVTLKHEEFLKAEGKPYRSRTEAKLSFTPELRQAMDIDLSDFLAGSPDADVTYTKLATEKAEAEIALDLKNANLFVKPFGYNKPVNSAGEATFKALLENTVLQELQNLTVTAPELKVEPSRILFAKTADGNTVPAKGSFARLVVGETVAGLDFERSSAGQYKIVMKGPFLDARPFLKESPDDEEDGDNPPLIVSIAVDQMRTAEGQAIQYAKLYADINADGSFNQFEMDGIAGKGDIYLRFKPDQQGKRIFNLEADDAGATLRAFDVYDKIEGGKLTIYGEPRRGIGDRNLVGKAVITDFKVVNAPSLARLLGALSLPGLIQLLNNEGLFFTKLEAGFDWFYKQEGSTLVLTDGRTSGNSLGFTFDGQFDQAQEKVDFSGTIIPLSGVNALIGNIPLVGDIITGGTGTLFAATYTIKGESEDPDISVNPLSVLAPGILRRILFE